MDLWQGLFSGARLIGWVLLHFVWQGVLLGAIYALLRQAVPRGARRYWLGMATLLGFALCLPATLWRLLDASPSGQVIGTASVLMAGTPVVAAGPSSWLTSAALNAVLPWLVLAWLGGISLLSFRAYRQWHQLKFLVRASELVPRWTAHLGVMAQRLGLDRPIDVLCSKAVAAPVIIGWIKPVILLPVAVVCNFSVSQIELILAHELAHLRRWDPLVNLFQFVLETLLFYHPVVRWVSREVRNEREICCDAMALSITGGSRHEFVGVLAELGELRERQTSMLLAANGGALLDRIQHVIVPERSFDTRARMPVAFMALLIAAAALVVFPHLQRKQGLVEENLSHAAAMIASPWLRLPLPRVDMAWHTAVTNLKPAIDPKRVSMAPVLQTLVDGGDGAQIIAHRRLLQDLAPLPVSRQLPVLRDPSVALSFDLQLAPVLAPAAVDAPKPVRIRGPVYPPAAWAAGIDGRVVIEFGLAADGRVENPRVVNATPSRIFDRAARDAVSAWQFSPPADATSQAKYRQVVVFSVNGDSDHGRGDREQGSGSDGCRVVTGTHICRDASRPEVGVNSIGASRSPP